MAYRAALEEEEISVQIRRDEEVSIGTEVVIREGLEEVVDSLGRNGVDVEGVSIEFIESALYGGVDGLTAYFSEDCRGGIFTSISALFGAFDHS